MKVVVHASSYDGAAYAHVIVEGRANNAASCQFMGMVDAEGEGYVQRLRWYEADGPRLSESERILTTEAIRKTLLVLYKKDKVQDGKELAVNDARAMMEALK